MGSRVSSLETLEYVEKPPLEVFREMGQWWSCPGFTAGLNGLRGLFQPK